MQADPLDGRDLGSFLARARETAGLDVQEVSTRLRMPVHIVRALEEGDYARLGAPVFVRGQLRSYARLLGVDIADRIADVERAAPVPAALVSHAHTPRARRIFEQATRRAAYIAITAAILVPIWLATKPHLSAPLSLDTLEPAPARSGDLGAAISPTPVVASIAPLPAAAAPADVPVLSLAFNATSWLEVVAPDGRALERAEVGAGQVRTFAAGEVGRVVLGNARAVRVLNRGRHVDAVAFSRANVARFTLSSDGSVTPLND